MSIDYYNANARTFFDETVQVEIAPLYVRFLAQLPAESHILDAGCGSGRDARAFLTRGHRVTAFDASPTLVALAAEHGGLPVQVKRFHEIEWHGEFDGIWACASLLHVPLAELPEVLERLAIALKPHGTLYASFKYGSGEREHGGRRFTDLDESGLAALLATTPAFTELETWTTADRRPGRADERWLNTLLTR